MLGYILLIATGRASRSLKQILKSLKDYFNKETSEKQKDS